MKMQDEVGELILNLIGETRITLFNYNKCLYLKVTGFFLFFIKKIRVDFCMANLIFLPFPFLFQ